jgi:multidrug resistance efflux pump
VTAEPNISAAVRRAVQDRGRPAPAPERAQAVPRDTPGQDTFAPDLLRTWLNWQCQMIAGLIHGVVYPVQEQGIADHFEARYPADGSPGKELYAASVEALDAGNAIALSRQTYGPNDKRACDILACPLSFNGRIVAVVAVTMAIRSEPQQRAVLQLIQWGSQWLTTTVNRRAHLVTLRDTLQRVVSAPDYDAALVALVDLAAERFSCERVSVGIRDGLHVKVHSISCAPAFDPRATLTRRIEACMEEACDQNASIAFSKNRHTTNISRAHAKLSGDHDDNAICTVPIATDDEVIGALCLERDRHVAFEQDAVLFAETIGRCVAPALALHRRAQRGFLAHARATVSRTKTAGPRLTRGRVIAAALATALVLGMVIPADYRVGATATLEGEVQRAVVVPHEGYIATATRRAGDEVAAGDLLATLDDSELKLEMAKWRSARNKHANEYSDALARHDRSDIGELRARIEQIDAEIALVGEKLSRTRLTAPFAGMVVSGDLSQALGSPVQTGQVLFEVAPLTGYRVVLNVAEQDVGRIKVGQRGHFLSAAMPGDPLEVIVQRIIPVAVASGGANTFRVEATLAQPDPKLRPGMRGVVKVSTGKRSLLWIATHSLIDRVRLLLWSRGL